MSEQSVALKELEKLVKDLTKAKDTLNALLSSASSKGYQIEVTIPNSQPVRLSIKLVQTTEI